jgi:hypothetical protein
MKRRFRGHFGASPPLPAPKIGAMNPIRLLQLAATVGAALILGACATGMDKNQCVVADWRMIGYEDGLRGYAAERIGAHRVACAKHQVTPNLAAYSEGRERGLVEFCQPKTGFRVGLQGGNYANVCPTATEGPFVHGYKWGRQIHDARADLRNTHARLRSARDGVIQGDSAMAAVSAELVQPKVTTERRAWLVQELVRLTQQRSELVLRIDELTVRAQQLSFDVSELERQSPYPL